MCTHKLTNFHPLLISTSTTTSRFKWCDLFFLHVCMTAAILWCFSAENCIESVFSTCSWCSSSFCPPLHLFLIIRIQHTSCSHSDVHTTLVQFLHVFHMVSWRSCTERCLLICDWLNLLPEWAELKFSLGINVRDDNDSVHKHCFCAVKWILSLLPLLLLWIFSEGEQWKHWTITICFAHNLRIHKEIKWESDFQNPLKQ